MKRASIFLSTAAAMLATPALAQSSGKRLCCGAKLAMTFNDAAPDVKLVILIFLAVTVASVIVWFLAQRRIATGRATGAARTLGFLAAWRSGGPLLGAAYAAQIQMNFYVAVYAYPPVKNYLRDAFAPNLAEVALVLSTGFLAGAVAALTHGHLQGRVQGAADAAPARLA